MELDFTQLTNGNIDRSGGDPAWVGDGILDKMLEVMNANIQVEYEKGRLTGPDYAATYLGMFQAALSESNKFLLNKDSVSAQVEGQEIDNAISENQLAENSEKWALQKKILGNQLDMSTVDLNYKEPNSKKDLELKDKQLESANADIAFNESKKTIMENTRKDNIRTKAAEQFAEFMKYISAANVVPGATDFQNMRDLVTAMNDGIANPDAKATLTSSGADYVKP